MMIFLMAWRNIWRNKTRSIVIMLSVAIGLFAGLGVLSLYKGMLKSRVRTVIDSETAHLQLHHPEFRKDYDPKFIIGDDTGIIARIRSIPGVRLVAPRSIAQGMLVTPTGSTGVQVNGVDPGLEYEVSGLGQKIREGQGFSEGKKNEIIVGKKLAEKMRLKLGSRLVLTFTDSLGEIVSSAFRVRAIYQSANAPRDEVNVYVPQTSLGVLLLTNNSPHEIAIMLEKDEDLPRIKSQITGLFPQLLVEDWKDISPETDLMVATVDQYSYIIMAIILIALAFGIINTMLMSVLERTREIGMMVALGTTRIRIFLLVFLETIMLTIVGTPLGLALALVLVGYFHGKGLDLSGMGEDMMASFGFNTMVYPEFPWSQLVSVMTMVVFTAILACVLPAIKALRLQPVEAIRR